MTTHDYTVREWGHDYAINRVEEDGLFLKAQGWGDGIASGDFLLLPNGTHTTRYRVETIAYLGDPPDMWDAYLRFAPRSEEDQS